MDIVDGGSFNGGSPGRIACLACKITLESTDMAKFLNEEEYQQWVGFSFCCLFSSLLS